jgi:hypothetical protein
MNREILDFQFQLPPEAAVIEGGPALQAQRFVDNPLIGLAQQFGEARGRGRAPRSALSELPNPLKITESNSRTT